MSKEKDDDKDKKDKEVLPDDETKELPIDPLGDLDDYFFENLLFPEDNIDHPSSKGLSDEFIDEVERQIREEEEFLNLDGIYSEDDDYYNKDDYKSIEEEELEYKSEHPDRIPKLRDYDVADKTSDHIGDGLLNPTLIDGANVVLFGWVDISVRMAVIAKLKDTPGCNISPVEIYAGTIINRDDIARKLYVQEFQRLKEDIFNSVIGNRGDDIILSYKNHLSFYETTTRKIFEYMKYIDYKEMFKEEDK